MNNMEDDSAVRCHNSLTLNKNSHVPATAKQNTMWEYVFDKVTVHLWSVRERKSERGKEENFSKHC